MILMTTKYSSKGDVYYSLGPETDHTVANGKYTLFVTGVRPVRHIIAMAQANNCTAIRLGHRGSYESDKTWPSTVSKLLEAGFTVTVQVPHSRLTSAVTHFSVPSISGSRDFILIVDTEDSLTSLASNFRNMVISFGDMRDEQTWSMSLSEALDSNRSVTNTERYGNLTELK